MTISQSLDKKTLMEQSLFEWPNPIMYYTLALEIFLGTAHDNFMILLIRKIQ